MVRRADGRRTDSDEPAEADRLKVMAPVLDGSLHLRCKGHCLSYEVLGEAKAEAEALLPNPRSFTPGQTPAQGAREKAQPHGRLSLVP